MKRLFAACATLVLALVALGCQSNSDAEKETVSSLGTPISVPAGAGSGQPSLVAGDDGTVWMSWVESVGDEQHALRYATLTDTSWSEPTTVARGADWFVNWADVPSLQPLPNGRLAAHYLQSNGSSSLAYAVKVAQTTSEGAWQSAVTPHDDGTQTEHGFASLLPWPNNRLLAVWLDGRKTAGKKGHHGEMTLRGAVLDASGTVEHQALLDGRTCECCPTSAVRVGDEALVAYRDRGEDEIRNIRLVRFDGQSWSDPMLLHDDGWQISGCPVNGPALAAEGDRVAAAWFTAPGGTPHVRVALSTDGGQTFGEPVEVAGRGAEGRVDLVLLEDGPAVVAWLGKVGDRAALRARAVHMDGSTGTPKTLATLPSTARGVGMPRLVHRDTRLYAAWTNPEAEKGGQVQLVRANPEALR